MSAETTFGLPWFRKHDAPGEPCIAATEQTVFVTSLEEVIRLCRKPHDRLKAAGSHWSLSTAAVSDHTFLETNDPANQRPAMSRTLHNVVPGCMSRERLDSMGRDTSPRSSFVHVEAGKRIYQAYAELDQVDPLDDRATLAGRINADYYNPAYAGPWAFATLGGAGGQTIVGAFNTGTHGGDFRLPPIADLVVAVHLVVDGGRHYWIESAERPLVDDDLIRAEFDRPELGGRDNFELLRDDDVFRAVLVSAGRFGVIYSVVLETVPQYSLYEYRGLDCWQDMKHLIGNKRSVLYEGRTKSGAAFAPASPVVGRNRFLQIVVCLTPHGNFTKNLVGVTQRWAQELPPQPAGRAERVGSMVGVDPRTECPLFEHAGVSHPYRPPDNPAKGPEPSFLESACADASFLRGVLQVVIEELADLVESDGAVIGPAVAAVALIAGTGVLVLLGAFVGLIVLLKELLDAFDDDTRLGEHMENLKNTLLDPPVGGADAKAAGLFAWQMIAKKIFESMQEDDEFGAISYAVMDRRDYPNISCEVNGDSLEVFFDAADDRLIAFIDALIDYERNQEFNGLAFVGYVSLRFTGPSWALLGMQQHRITCAVEIAGLKDVSGSQALIDYASRLALNPNIGARVHWGQHNDCTVADVERLYGDPTSPRSSAISRWRRALGRLSDNGRLDAFSSEFTRRTGLEVVSPALRELHVDRSVVAVGDVLQVSWDATNNPPGTKAALVVTGEVGDRRRVRDLPLHGSHALHLTAAGTHEVRLEVRSGRGDVRPASARTVVTVMVPEPRT